MILFAAATGLRPAEWIALEKRDVDRDERVVYVRRSFTKRELKHPKTEASMRAVPLQARALDALERIEDGNGSPRSFPASEAATPTSHHFRPFQWRPAQEAVEISPLRRVYDLRHTFATFALRPEHCDRLPLVATARLHNAPSLPRTRSFLIWRRLGGS